jgi:mRNA (2'-O-methyladenosine-N6-)-methyltransferase
MDTLSPPPFYINADLRTFNLLALEAKFDVILLNPPWLEYAERLKHLPNPPTMDAWSIDDLSLLPINAISNSPSFLYMWAGSHDNVESCIDLMRMWGFRRCEDIVWVKTNKTKPGFASEGNALHRTTEHCLMGIKGTVRRAHDTHLIHANIDTDVIISEEPPLG